MTRVTFGPFRFDPATGELWRGSGKVSIQTKPAEVLAVLVARRGELVSRAELIRAVWGDRFVDGDLSLNYCIGQIRAALGEAATSPQFLETIRGRGYRFALEPTVLTAPAVWWRRRSVAMGAAAVCAIALTVGIRERRRATPAADVIVSVMPFANLTSVAACDRLANMVRATLAREVTGAPTHIAVRLHADPAAQFLLTGVTRGAGSARWFSAYLIRTSDGRVVWQASFETAALQSPRGRRAVAGGMLLALSR